MWGAGCDPHILRIWASALKWKMLLLLCFMLCFYYKMIKAIIVCLVSVGDDRTSIRIITRIVTIVQSEQAMRIADELSDMILFHKRVRENGNAI